MPSTHQVAAGETAYGIARRYGLTVDALLRNNGLTTAALQPGQQLRLTAGNAATPVKEEIPLKQPVASQPEKPTAINNKTRQPSSRERVPKKRAYVIQKGDTLTTISRRFKVDLKDLMQWNGLKPKSTLRPGETVLIHLAKAS